MTPVLSGAILVPEPKGGDQFTVPTPDPKTVRGPSDISLASPELARVSRLAGARKRELRIKGKTEAAAAAAAAAGRLEVSL